MWFFKRRLHPKAFFFLAVLGIAGCGFRPQYATYHQWKKHNDGAIYVHLIPDRYGQILRNYITDFLGTGNAEVSPYTLNIQLTASHRNIGVDKNLNATRYEVLLGAAYEIKGREKSGKPLLKGTCRSSEYYSVSKVQIFENITAAENAPKRGLEIVSRCVIDRVTALLPLLPLNVEKERHEKK